MVATPKIGIASRTPAVLWQHHICIRSIMSHSKHHSTHLSVIISLTWEEDFKNGCFSKTAYRVRGLLVNECMLPRNISHLWIAVNSFLTVVIFPPTFMIWYYLHAWNSKKMNFNQKIGTNFEKWTAFILRKILSANCEIIDVCLKRVKWNLIAKRL